MVEKREKRRLPIEAGKKLRNGGYFSLTVLYCKLSMISVCSVCMYINYIIYSTFSHVYCCTVDLGLHLKWVKKVQSRIEAEMNAFGNREQRVSFLKGSARVVTFAVVRYAEYHYTAVKS